MERIAGKTTIKVVRGDITTMAAAQAFARALQNIEILGRWNATGKHGRVNRSSPQRFDGGV